MKKLLFGGLVGLLVTACSLTAAPIYGDSVSLATLVSGGGTLTVGDKVFSDFDFDFGCNNCSPPDATSITVRTINDDGTYGIRFSSGFTAGGLGSFGHYIIDFVVTATDPTLGISGVSMSFNGNTSGPNAYTSVTETIRNNANGQTLGQIAVTAPPPVLDASTDIAVTSSLHIIKDIQLGVRPSGTAADFATISVIDQMFVQTPNETDIPGGQIPEPYTFLLMGTGLVGLAMTRRHMKKS